MDSEQIIRIALTVITPILTAGIGIAALVVGDWRERRTQAGRRKLAVEDAGRQVAFAAEWFNASKLIADSPDAQQRAAARAQAWLDEASELLAESKPPPPAEEKRSVTVRRLLLAYPMHRRGARSFAASTISSSAWWFSRSAGRWVLLSVGRTRSVSRITSRAGSSTPTSSASSCTRSSRWPFAFGRCVSRNHKKWLRRRAG